MWGDSLPSPRQGVEGKDGAFHAFFTTAQPREAGWTFLLPALAAGTMKELNLYYSFSP